MGKAGFFLILYDSALSTCCAMNGMLRDGCHFETRKDSVANARVVDVVVCIMMGGNLCDVFVLFRVLLLVRIVQANRCLLVFAFVFC